MPPKMRIPDIISQVYSKRYKLKNNHWQNSRSFMDTPLYYPVGRYAPYGRYSALNKIKRALSNHYVLTILCAALIIKTIMAVYFYNILVSSEQNMRASYSNMSALMQRRNDMAANLSKTVLDYSKYEKSVFTSIVGLRTLASTNNGLDKTSIEAITKALPEESAASSSDLTDPSQTAALASGKNMLASLSKLMAVAEQYPDLKLSTNFATLMTALVEVEKDLANQRIKFNAEANVYTTYLHTFPINFFARVFNFEDFPYFEASEEAKSFKLLAY
nr:LemA family protein [Desulfobulbaceae bacterium]